MKWGVIKAYIAKEFIELIRTRLIILPYLMPTMILLLFGYGIRMEVTDARIVILDNDHSHFSRMLTEKFEHSRYFDATISQMRESEALHLIKQAKVDMILIIPSSFEKKLLHGQKSEIGLFVDAAFSSRATTMESYVQGVILQAAAEVGDPRLQKGMITINNRNLFNQAMRDENAMVPGLIGLVLLVAPAILSALLIVKEKEKGTIFNFYASPVSKFEFIIAKLTPVFMIHSLNIFILFLWATYLFEVPFRGSFGLYWVASELYIFISLGIGMLISIITRSQIATAASQSFTTLGYLQNIVLEFSKLDFPVELKSHKLFNQNADNHTFMALSEMLSVITMLAILLPAMVFVKEKEEGTWDIMLLMPVDARVTILAKSFSQVLIIVAGTVICVGFVLFGMFDMPMNGSFWAFLLLTVLYTFTTAGIGLFIAAVSKNILQVAQLSMIVMMPLIFLSGAWTPVYAMHPVLKTLSFISPLRYYIEGCESIFFRGTAFVDLWIYFIGVLILGSVLYWYGFKKIGKLF